MSDLKITLPRTELLTALQEKRTALEAEYDAKVQTLTDERDNLPNTAALLKDWFVEIAAMLAAGEARVSAGGDIFAIDPDTKDVPSKPNKSTGGTNKRHLNQTIAHTKDMKERSLREVDASIRLLTLATDVEVSVPVSQYESLLSLSTTTRGFYHY